MIVCVSVYIFLIFWKICGKRVNILRWMSPDEAKKLWRIFLAANTLAFLLFFSEVLRGDVVTELFRNGYGEGSRIEEYEVSIEGELEEERLQIEVQEREYTQEQVQEIFQEMIEKLDKAILGENENFDHIEKDLNLVNSLEGYPVDIRWELSNYKVFDTEGHVIQENTTEEGTLVEIRGILSYRQQEAIYMVTVMVYPETKTGKDRWMQALQDKLAEADEDSREDEVMPLPESLDGKQVYWEKKKSTSGYYVLGFGVLIGVILIWNERKDRKESLQKRREQMERDYPDIVSKMVLLLTTGMTVKQTWKKITQAYDEQIEYIGTHYAYEEMKVACNEMQGGISEAESYERFGRRCDMAIYMKFGALLSQNLRKGSKGLSDLLRVESIQAFENRKSLAKRRGEEAGTKLMLPMMGMLAVVLIMVIVPAFLSMDF